MGILDNIYTVLDAGMDGKVSPEGIDSLGAVTSLGDIVFENPAMKHTEGLVFLLNVIKYHSEQEVSYHAAKILEAKGYTHMVDFAMELQGLTREEKDARVAGLTKDPDERNCYRGGPRHVSVRSDIHLHKDSGHTQWTNLCLLCGHTEVEYDDD